MLFVYQTKFFYFSSSSSSSLSFSLRKCFTVFSKSLYASTVTPHSYLRMSESAAAAAAAAAEHDYIGLSEFPTMEATQIISDKTEDNNNNDVLNFKATELRLGLPGSESPERVGFMSLKSSCPVSGAKRVFSDAINGSTKWVFSPGSATDVKDIKPAVPVKEKKSSAPASKYDFYFF